MDNPFNKKQRKESEMESFTFYRDTQVSMWTREHFEIEAETKEKAIEILLSQIEKGDECADEFEYLYDTISDTDNSELLDTDGNKIERAEK